MSLGWDQWDKPACPQGCLTAGSRRLHVYRAHVLWAPLVTHQCTWNIQFYPGPQLLKPGPVGIPESMFVIAPALVSFVIRCGEWISLFGKFKDCVLSSLIKCSTVWSGVDALTGLEKVASSLEGVRTCIEEVFRLMRKENKVIMGQRRNHKGNQKIT